MFADKNGRKPGIVISILSVIVFNTLFGLSTTYWMAIVTRGLLGLLCGILGPIKAYASEVCRKEHQALGISLVTSSRAIALVIGPAIGGFLAQDSGSHQVTPSPHVDFANRCLNSSGGATNNNPMS
ncbi:protein ZINC INDUCED FACILITATOR-LIKE 1-like [Zea mays]|uniref:protein ZINC INDUCED FACILITATOR-LIKE 1-like n=1 Tax=Zea mays TaxID=4577 RepID=UPI00165206D0|nr:protein ZINC INDUCED FACILITATOR-LIKE 1-like [Zea mays]